VSRAVRPGTYADKRRGTSTQRGYGAPWRRLREQVLKRDKGLCQCPDCEGGKKRVTLAREVDHIIPRAEYAAGRVQGDPDDLSNLRAVASSCHRKISLAQRGFKRRPRIDVAGWPIEDDR